MAFIQLIEFHTSNYEELAAIDQKWRDATEGKRTLRRSIVARDRNDPDRYVVLAFFDDYDSAMANSSLPETAEFAAQEQAIADAPARFVDLEVIDDRE